MGYVVLFLNLLFSVCYAILILRAVLPWIPHDRKHPLIRPIYEMTDPVLGPIRAGLPPQKIGFDVAPFLLMILLWFIQGFVVRVVLVSI